MAYKNPIRYIAIHLMPFGVIKLAQNGIDAVLMKSVEDL